jgi:NAD(P)-dependent dehydrogenase (short-subunit alcohol dehydrogenase family)
MSETRTALVTGANKGIGYEIAAGLGRSGFRVGVGARDAVRRTEAVEKLRAEGLDAFGIALDVTDDDSVAAAAWELDSLDVLINNAGIVGPWDQTPTTANLDTIRTVVDTNVLGTIRVTNAVLPLLRNSPAGRIVNVSSSVGSLTLQTGTEGGFGPLTMAYAPSKTFLNAVTVAYAKELRGTGILVNAGCPGYVRTDLNGGEGFRTPVEGARVFLELATLPDDGPHGAFFDENGPVPWWSAE